jgi:hypothetical protein
MAITNKTRRTLWARAGNRCAMCQAELVAKRNNHDRNLNIGDECHIISKRTNGPRHNKEYDKNYDDYENLILLCKNHHKQVDELWEKYTATKLSKIKKNHEKWIKTTIDNAKSKVNTKSTKLMPRLTSGKQIVDIIHGANAYQFDHCDFKTQDEADYVSSLLQNLQDWTDLSGFADFEIWKQVQLSYEMNRDLEELEKRGFFIFGERRSTIMTDTNRKEFDVWYTAILVVMRKDDPLIKCSEKLAANGNEFNHIIDNTHTN